MKRIAIITLLLVVLSAVGVSAGENPSWDIHKSPELDYDVQQGEIDYTIMPIEQIVDGLDHALTVDYGIFENAQVGSSVYLNNNVFKIDGRMKYNFLKKNGWTLSGEGEFFYEEYSSYNDMDSNGRLLISKDLSDNLTFDGNVAIIYTDIARPAYEYGVTYQIDGEQTVKANMETLIRKDNYDRRILTAAYKAELNDRTNFIFNIHKNFLNTNVRYTHGLEIKPSETVEVRTGLSINTSQSYANSLSIDVEKEVNENVTLKAGLDKQGILAPNDYYAITTGINYQF